MKRIMLVGRTFCGKTTLCQALNKEALRYRKTQDIQFLPNAIDTPGEYMENARLYRALMVTSVEAQVIILVQSCIEPGTLFPPGFSGMFGDKPVIGVASKVDLAGEEEQIAWTIQSLRDAGASCVFPLSAVTGQGIPELRGYLGEQ